MREIKFRGKRVDNGEWVFGYYLSYGVDMYSCGEIIGTKDEYYIVTPCHEDFNYEHTFEVRKETLCQYSGLKDKNGVDIYEGDMLGDKNNIIEFSYGCFNTNGDRPIAWQLNLEIIGNIHDKIKQ